ncbi:MAG: SDR family NAD(P)-dependent oxidoreductase [Gemmatimonadales bacterium]|nr:SDR family NAD(P)-dependent oxidoreductase [Gemmatimonadales bacterium]
MPNNRKKAIIIGATSGIGLALAELLASKNFHLGLSGRRTHLMDGFRGGGHHITAMDVADTDSSRQTLVELIKEMGGVDLIVLNAGRGSIRPKIEWENEKRTIDVNVTGFAALATVAFEHFQQQGHGHLVGISSVAAIRGGGGHPAYNASKAFLSNYLQGLRHDARRSGLPIAITDIKPGFVDTAMAQGDGIFWVASPEKAARQIYCAIRRRRKHAYITRRWALIGWLLGWLPDWVVYRK